MQVDNLTIDLASLEVTGLPQQGPHLEFYGTPVRLVALVWLPVVDLHCRLKNLNYEKLLSRSYPNFQPFLIPISPFFGAGKGNSAFPDLFNRFSTI